MKPLDILLTNGVLAATVLLTGCASAPEAGLSHTDQLMRQADPRAAVALTVNPPQVRVGDVITMQTGSALPGYLYVVQLGTDGRTLSLVFPNAMDGTNQVPGGGAAVKLPRPNWRLTARGPAGVGYFVAIVAEKPQDLTRLAQSLKEGRIGIDGPYGAAMATLREVAL